MTAKSIVRSVTHRFGYDVVRSTPTFVDFMDRHGLTTVLDVGANEGQYVRQLRDRGYAGQVVSFEPIPEVFAVLSAASGEDRRWTAHNIGLGNADERREITVTKWSVFSSFKRPSAYIEGFDGRAVASHQVAVQVARLDTFARSHPFDPAKAYLKVDTQGFEREVIEGAGSLLDEIRAVQLELPMKHLYDGQPDWLSMIGWMAGRGFHVAMVNQNNHDPRTLEAIELDVVFANGRFIKA